MSSTPQVPPQAPQVPQAVPPKKGTSPLVWILVGCGGLLFIGAILVAGVIWWSAHKIKNYAQEVEKNPAIAIAKLAVAANPDLEVVSEDYDRGTLTIRNKKTGEQITMNAEDIKEGRLRFQNEKGQEVTFEGSGEKGHEGLTIKSDEGTVTVGQTGKQQLPVWVPTYPGVTPVVTLTKSGEEGLYGNYSFQTGDSVDMVLNYFESGLETAGFSVEKTSIPGGVIAMGTLNAKTESGKREVVVSVIPVGTMSQVTVQYTSKEGADQ
ncbi:MAG: hypothetical protein AB1714_26750 [Acidobacteriota bacterium]